MPHARGEAHHNATLTDHEVALLRTLHRAGLSYRVLAEKFEVAVSTAWAIANGLSRLTPTPPRR